ncbi:MAG: type II toxin-antitoxin system HicB family antitoxin [Thermodesulfobacteriota bacterium]
MRLLEMPVIVFFEEDTYIAKCPLIEGAFAEGETPEDAIKELIDVVKMILDYKKERGEKLVDDLVMETDKVITTIPIEIL